MISSEAWSPWRLVVQHRLFGSTLPGGRHHTDAPMCLLQVPNGRVAAPAGSAAPQVAPQQQRPKGSPGGAAAAAASADDGQLGDVPKLSPAFEVRTALDCQCTPRQCLRCGFCITLCRGKHALLAQCQSDATFG